MFNSYFSLSIATILILVSSGVYGAINFSQYFPNGSGIVQSQVNGWTTPVSGLTKEIMSPDGCKVISSSNPQTVHVPTRTTAEWNAFTANRPVGINITNCSTYTYSWNIGAYGSCSVTCGGGTQTRVVTCQRNDGVTVADSNCTGAKPATSQGCNTNICPVLTPQCGASIGTCTVGSPSAPGYGIWLCWEGAAYAVCPSSPPPPVATPKQWVYGAWNSCVSNLFPSPGLTSPCIRARAAYCVSVPELPGERIELNRYTMFGITACSFTIGDPPVNNWKESCASCAGFTYSGPF